MSTRGHGEARRVVGRQVGWDDGFEGGGCAWALRGGPGGEGEVAWVWWQVRWVGWGRVRWVRQQVHWVRQQVHWVQQDHWVQQRVHGV